VLLLSWVMFVGGVWVACEGCGLWFGVVLVLVLCVVCVFLWWLWFVWGGGVWCWGAGVRFGYEVVSVGWCCVWVACSWGGVVAVVGVVGWFLWFVVGWGVVGCGVWWCNGCGWNGSICKGGASLEIL